MKVEMFEKVGEIEIVELRSAVENKAIAEIERARKAEEERLRKEKEEREKDELAVKVATWIAEEINKKAENGEDSLEILFEIADKHPYGFYECLAVEKRIKEIFTSLGYDVRDIYEYSQSWKTRSGRWGYWSFHWSKV